MSRQIGGFSDQVPADFFALLGEGNEPPADLIQGNV
jgi:hypothetical protein